MRRPGQSRTRVDLSAIVQGRGTVVERPEYRASLHSPMRADQFDAVRANRCVALDIGHVDVRLGEYAIRIDDADGSSWEFAWSFPEEICGALPGGGSFGFTIEAIDRAALARERGEAAARAQTLAARIERLGRLRWMADRIEELEAALEPVHPGACWCLACWIGYLVAPFVPLSWRGLAGEAAELVKYRTWMRWDLDVYLPIPPSEEPR